MILRHLSSSNLQRFVGGDLISRLEVVLPGLLPGDFDPTTIYKKDTLLKILSSFSPSQRFRDKEFRRTLLNSLPPDVLKTICKEIEVGSSSDDFETLVSKVLKRGWNDQNFCTAFIEASELPREYIPKPKKTVQYEELCKRSSWPYKRLKTYQFDVYRKAVEKLEVNLSRFIIQMPTGSGKTRTAMEIIANFLNNSPENAAVVWLAHSEELCEQCIECFHEVWEHIGERDIKLYRCWGASKELPSENEGTLFIVGGFQKLYSLLKRNQRAFDLLQERMQLLVVDEAHKVIAPTYKEVSMALIGRSTRVVGLTATPGRSASDVNENVGLANFFFDAMIGIEIPNEESIFEYLRRKKILSRVTRFPLETSNSYELSKKQITYLEQRFDFPPGFLQTLGKDDIRNSEIIKRLYEECKANRQILFFACSIEHSRFICALLVFLGIKAAHLDGDTPKGERSHVIEAFKKNEIQVLCNYGVLSTGFDAPKIDVVFIARPTNSIVLYSQMVGRGLRGPKIGGTTQCKVIEVVDNITNLPDANRIYDYFDEYWSL